MSRCSSIEEDYKRLYNLTNQPRGARVSGKDAVCSGGAKVKLMVNGVEEELRAV